MRKYLIISTPLSIPKTHNTGCRYRIFKDPLPNPSSGGRVEDLSPLYDVGSEIGDVLMKDIASIPDQGAIVSYGKAGMASADNDLENWGLDTPSAGDETSARGLGLYTIKYKS